MTATVRLDIGLQYAQNKQYDEAIKEFTSLLSQDQTVADAFFYRGCAYLHLGQYEAAIQDFSSAISSVNLSLKHELRASYKRGYAYYKTNQFDSALDDYKHYLRLCKSHPELDELRHRGLFQMGIINATLNKNDTAIEYFTNAIGSSTDSEEHKLKLYYLHRGRAYACCAKYDEAEADLKLAREQSDDPFIRGCAYNELGQHQDALREFDDSLQPNGKESLLVGTDKHHIRFRRGLSSASLNLHDRALSDFQSALDTSKQQCSSNITDRILFRKGMSNMALHHPHRALVDFNESTKLNNTQSDVFYARGMLHYTLGRHDAAVFDHRKAMELEKKSPSLAPNHTTNYHTVKHGDSYNYYENKIREAEELLKKNQGTPNEPIIYYQIANYYQNQAPHSNDPVASCESARENIKKAGLFRHESRIDNSIALAVNSFFIVYYLDEKYSKREMPNATIEQYINCEAETILSMSVLFDECITNGNWHNLVETLKNELSKANIQRVSNTDIRLITYINGQLEKAKTIQKTMSLFDDSPAQKEFYGLLANRLWNLLDGVRMASTGIFSHSLEGTFTKVSWAFKLLGKLFGFVPIGSQYGDKVFGLCETGFKKLDETRIQNALTHLGRNCNPEMINKTADAIATELTKMYENQIKRFLTTLEEKEVADATAANNNDQQQKQPSVCSKCASCFNRCKNRALNDMELSTIKTIVEYGASLFLDCLVQLKVADIKQRENIPNIFVNAVCRPPKILDFHIKALADKIKPKDAKSDKERWDVYDFFRRPAIDFENGIIRAQKETDRTKFGCRKPTSEEKQLLITKPEEFNDKGFKIIIKTDNLS